MEISVALLSSNSLFCIFYVHRFSKLILASLCSSVQIHAGRYTAPEKNQQLYIYTLKFIAKMSNNFSFLKTMIYNTHHVDNALRPVKSNMLYCRKNVHFLSSFNLFNNIEGSTEQSTSISPVPKNTNQG